MLETAVSEAVGLIEGEEKEWDQSKLEKKLRDYFNKASKHLTFRGTKLPALINEYADNAMSSVFAGLGDREWLYSGKVDFLLCIDAGIKETFPGHLLRNLQQHDFEPLVLAAYDRAFDEQRFYPILSDAVPNVVSGPKIKKKVWNSVDAGRKEAVATGTEDAEEFTATWISQSIAHLAQASQGSPDGTMSSELCAQLFHLLLEGGGLPMKMTQEQVPPTHLVDEAVSAGYLEHAAQEEAEAAWSAGPPAKRQKQKQQKQQWDENQQWDEQQQQWEQAMWS